MEFLDVRYLRIRGAASAKAPERVEGIWKGSDQCDTRADSDARTARLNLACDASQLHWFKVFEESRRSKGLTYYDDSPKTHSKNVRARIWKASAEREMPGDHWVAQAADPRDRRNLHSARKLAFVLHYSELRRTARQ